MKILSNLYWQFGNQAISILNGVVVGAMVARHLGPENVGVLANAMSLVGIVGPILALGLDSILIREYIQTPSSRSRVFWTVISARFVLCILVMFGLFIALNSKLLPTTTRVEYFALCFAFLSIFANPLAIFKLLFDAEVSSKYAIWAANAIVLVSAFTKVWMVFQGFTLVAFAFVALVEIFAINIATFAIAKHKRFVPEFCLPSWTTFRSLIAESWPMMLSGLCVAIYLNVDMAMLRSIRGPAEAGIYSVAVRMSTLWSVIPTIVCASFFPALAALHRSDRDRYWVRLRDFFSLNIAMSYLCVLFSLVVLPMMIRVLYGPKYEASIPVFFCHIFSIIFVFWGVARSQHLTLERLHAFSMWATFCGMLVNVSCNCVLIPKFGAMGAAVSTLAGQSVAALFSSAFMPRHASTFGLQLESIYLKNFFSRSFFELRRITR
ncbi:MAG: flippase [Pirellulaceae bacterium]|nr:flippase [Pirellulaceae bacterium]